MRTPTWLRWARRLQAIAQSGLTYAKDPFDIERYKSVTKVAAEMAAAHSGVDPDHVYGLFGEETGYATPKLDVRGVVFWGDAVLMIREREDGLWALPGGWVDVGESPSEAAIREVYEESGYRVRVSKLLALYDRDKHPHSPLPFHIYKLFFLCEVLGGEPIAESIETDGIGFFEQKDLPRLSITRVTHGQMARLFEHRRNPHWPTDFD